MIEAYHGMAERRPDDCQTEPGFLSTKGLEAKLLRQEFGPVLGVFQKAIHLQIEIVLLCQLDQCQNHVGISSGDSTSDPTNPSHNESDISSWSSPSCQSRASDA